MLYGVPVASLGFVRLPAYVNAAKGLLSDEDERDIEQMLIVNPEVGVTIGGTGGVRKLCVPLQGRGKSGGARVIYFYRASSARVYLLYVYKKNEADNLSAAGKVLMKKLVQALESEK